MSDDKICANCSRSYDAAAWAALRFIGVNVWDDEDTGATEVHELRDCPCGNTLSRVIGMPQQLVGALRDLETLFHAQKRELRALTRTVAALPAHLALALGFRL